MQKTFDTPGAANLYVEIGSGTLTVRTDDQGMDTVRGIFFDHRARHVLGAEMAG